MHSTRLLDLEDTHNEFLVRLDENITFTHLGENSTGPLKDLFSIAVGWQQLFSTKINRSLALLQRQKKLEVIFLSEF